MYSSRRIGSLGSVVVGVGRRIDMTGLGGGATGLGQLADQPVRLDRVVEPGLGPALLDTCLDGARVDALAVDVEQRQLAARLVEASFQRSKLTTVSVASRRRAIRSPRVNPPLRRIAFTEP
jgi:hypothetical protein